MVVFHLSLLRAWAELTKMNGKMHIDFNGLNVKQIRIY